MKHLLAAVAIVCFASAAIPVHANELAGTWIFEKEVDTRADGTKVAGLAQEYEGMITYTPDGFVSATIMPRGRHWTLATASRPARL